MAASACGPSRLAEGIIAMAINASSPAETLAAEALGESLSGQRAILPMRARMSCAIMPVVTTDARIPVSIAAPQRDGRHLNGTSRTTFGVFQQAQKKPISRN